MKPVDEQRRDTGKMTMSDKCPSCNSNETKMTPEGWSCYNRWHYEFSTSAKRKLPSEDIAAGRQDGEQELPAKERIERTVKCTVCGWYTPGIPQQENWEALAEITRLSTRIDEIQAKETEAVESLARERERHQELRQVVKEYRQSNAEHEECEDYSKWDLTNLPHMVIRSDIRCPICIKADLLLAPAPADTKEKQ